VVHNFNPGPAVLPDTVREEVANAVRRLPNSSLGILEISHRGRIFEEILASAEARIRRLLAIPDDFAVMFCHGGATMQFSMVPLNLGQAASSKPEYLISGVWSQKAFAEASRLVGATQNGSGELVQFKELPKVLATAPGCPYLHYTSNNTIYGTQWTSAPTAEACSLAPLVCDASSDLFSASVDFSRHDAVYACAQKNFGCSGLTIAVVRSNLLDQVPKNLPILLSYQTYAKNQSLYNTPATFAIFVAERYLAWIENLGGLAEMHRRARERAQRVYACIDEFPVYLPYAEPASRSLMNATFRIEDSEREKKFLKEAESAGLFGLKGHKLLGGIRVSMYNGLSMGAIEDLTSFMKEFAIRWDS
jgi:phosphoserine aminotransferase